MMAEKEKMIKLYFESWLKKDAAILENIFDTDIVYSECYAPEYHGIGQIKSWFADWNRRGTVLRWDIKQFVHQENKIAVEWYFQCEYDGVTDCFDGVSLVLFNDTGKIVHLKEFQSKAEHIYPYGK